MDILAIIPARSGSKSVKDKNIRMIGDKPMLAYSILHAQQSKYITRVIVDTDSEKYAQIASTFGAEAPYLRPAEYATDTALDFDVFFHALTYLQEKEKYSPEIVVQLRPTYPIRNVSDIDKMIEMLLQDTTADSVRTIAPAKEIAYKMWRQEEDGTISPILTDIKEAYNMPRQKLPPIFYQNACIDVIRTNTILNLHSMSGHKILGYQMEHNFDIDTQEEFERADKILRIKQGGQRFVFDIDGVIAEKRADLDYAQATPNVRMIQIINQLYEWGNQIILFTARGYVTKINWYPVTKKTLACWGLKYHELLMGKPNADFYVDDHFISMDFLYDEFGE